MLLIVLKFIVLLPYLLVKYIIDKRKRGIHLYGIYGYFGLPGKGKTIAMSRRLKELRKQYGDNIYIMTNYCHNPLISLSK